MRDSDTHYVVRAFAICAVIVNHAVHAPLAGGLNVLLLLSGIAFAQLCFGGLDNGPIWVTALRFMRPLMLWSIVLCLFWSLVFRHVELAEILMYSNWITPSRVSKFPIWYTQALMQIMIVLVALFSGLRLTDRMRATPVWGSVFTLMLTVALASLSQWFFDMDRLGDKLPHLHAWNFVLGWLFWAVLVNRAPTAWHRGVMSLLSVALMVFMFVGLDAPAALSRVCIAIAPALLLIWCPKIRLPVAILQPTLLISQATLFLFFLHYPFILTMRNLLSDTVSPTALGFAKAVAGILGPVLIWALVTSAQRTFREAKARQKTSPARGFHQTVSKAPFDPQSAS